MRHLELGAYADIKKVMDRVMQVLVGHGLKKNAGCNYASLAGYVEELTEETVQTPKHVAFYIDYYRLRKSGVRYGVRRRRFQHRNRLSGSAYFLKRFLGSATNWP